MARTVEDARAWYAEDLRVVANLQSAALVDALATIARERFLPPGPWTIFGTEVGAAPRLTDSDDPGRVYHNVSVAIDPARMLFNGQPGLIASWLDALRIAPGDRVLHIGCATGYYTALAARMTGPDGAVDAIEVDPALAEHARRELAEWPWVTVATSDGTAELPQDYDVLLVNAGATHILETWIAALSPRGRMLVPLTVTMPGMPGPISKGITVLVERRGDEFAARLGSMVAIYSLVGARDDAMNSALANAFRAQPMPRITRLRRDAHERSPECWLHWDHACLS